jgi:hypothetical protein
MVLLGLVGSGCAAGTTITPSGDSASPPASERDFYLGMVPTPKSVPATTFDDITAAYEEAGRISEIVMVWGSPGGIGLYEKLRQNRVITGVRVYGLKPVITLNFHTIKEVPGQGLQPVVDAPEGIKAAADDPEFRQLWVTEAENIAREFQPEYFSLGNEINDYFYHHPEDLDEYLSLYDTAYTAIKRVSPETRVMVVLSYTHLIDNDQWDMLSEFSARTDVLGLTTYPWKHYTSPDAIAPDYYSRLNDYLTVPVAFTEVGWAGGETAEAEFLAAFPELTRELEREMINWLFLHEIELEGIGQSVFSPESGTIALKKADGTPKEVYDIWLELKQRELNR